jgi:HAD superfamily hydrolase (TIGR01459 family)
MSSLPTIISGLHEIAPDHDALICDVWGVLHNGKEPFLAAADALKRFRARGPVILLTNAPRPVADVEIIFKRIGVPLDCYDAIVTSGVAAREDLIVRSKTKRLAVLHIGPERDLGLFEGVNANRVPLEQADIVLCTGPYDDETETPDDYEDTYGAMLTRKLTLLCANPDMVVQRGDKLIYCAGALAKAYERLGGQVVYYGKPYAPIYEAVRAAARKAAGREIARPLAVGDGVDTDIKGANLAGIDALFIADGVHAAQLGELTATNLAQFLLAPGVQAKAAMRALVW